MAEFGLLDAQLANLKRVLAEIAGSETGEDGLNGDVADVDGSQLDEDELEVSLRSTVSQK